MIAIHYSYGSPHRHEWSAGSSEMTLGYEFPICGGAPCQWRGVFVDRINPSLESSQCCDAEGVACLVWRKAASAPGGGGLHCGRCGPGREAEEREIAKIEPARRDGADGKEKADECPTSCLDGCREPVESQRGRSKRSKYRR